MKTIFTVLACCAAVAVFAQEKMSDAKKDDSKGVSLHGYLVDAMCAKNMAGKETTMKKAMAHSRKCALEESCAETGYGVFSDGKWFKFDDAGDKQAKALLEKTTTEKGIEIEVSGKMSGEKLAVAALKEHKMEKKSEAK